MTEAGLITAFQIFNTPDARYFAAHRVIGLSVPAGKTVMEYGSVVTGSEIEMPVRLPDEGIDRLAEFYDRTIAREPESRPHFSCHSLTWFVMGQMEELKEYQDLHCGVYIPADHFNLVAGQPYAIESKDGGLNHSPIGLPRPDASLSVVGSMSPMVVMENIELLELYKGAGMHHIDPQPLS